MYLTYYYGKYEDETLEIECTFDMMRDCLLEQFDNSHQMGLVDILLEEIDEKDLFDAFYDLFLDYYKEWADDIRDNCE